MNEHTIIDCDDMIDVTATRRHHHYSFYYMGLARLFVLGIIPLSSLMYFNLKIYNGVRCSSNLSELDDERNQRNQRENDMAKVLIGIVVTFIICNLFRVVTELDNMIMAKKAAACEDTGEPAFYLWSLIIDYLSDLMMVINSSINMTIYGCLNSNFRKHILCCNK